MPDPLVLVVDDERPIRVFLRAALSSRGYAIAEAASGKDALAAVATQKPDIVILDLGLPDVDGTEVTRLLRQWTRVPIIILSVRGSEDDKIGALDAGADDYLTKPFGIGELLARLRAALRRSVAAEDGQVFESRGLRVDLAQRLVSASGRKAQLTPHEYGILRALVAHAGKVLTHNHLLHDVWGPEYRDEFHILHVNISNLRRKIEPDPARPSFIITEPGVGYRLRAE
jgi:two-component system KDP operon response regulator KdpE